MSSKLRNVHTKYNNEVIHYNIASTPYFVYLFLVTKQPIRFYHRVIKSILLITTSIANCIPFLQWNIWKFYSFIQTPLIKWQKNKYARLPAMTVSLRLYFELAFGKSFSFLLLSFNSPLWFASSSIFSSDLVNWFCMCPFIFEANTAMTHGPQHDTHSSTTLNELMEKVYVTMNWQLNLPPDNWQSRRLLMKLTYAPSIGEPLWIN